MTLHTQFVRKLYVCTKLLSPSCCKPNAVPEMEGQLNIFLSRSESATTSYEMKQLNAQNEKLRDTLVKMRDLAAHEKTENIRLIKDLEETQHQVRLDPCNLMSII